MRTLSNFLFNVLISDPAWILPNSSRSKEAFDTANSTVPFSLPIGVFLAGNGTKPITQNPR
jgi:hypothetical protein